MLNDKESRNAIVNVLDKNFIVEASAGSGKTTILVERMVALVESGVPVNQIAAITFTKKAANEFYERFFKKLQLRSSPDFDVIKDDKRSCLSQPTITQKELDKIALKNIDTCFLGTIDSFCNAILQEHPLDANIPSSSTIIEDESQIDLILEDAYECIFSRPDMCNPRILEYYIAIKNKEKFIKLAKWLLNLNDQEVIFDNSNLDANLELYEKYIAEFKYICTEITLNPSYYATNATATSGPAIAKFKQMSSTIRKLSPNLFDIKNIKSLLRVVKDMEFDLENVSDSVICKYACNIKQKSNKFSLDLSHISNLLDEIEYTITMTVVLAYIDQIKDELNALGYLTFSSSIHLLAKLLRKDNGKTIDVISKVNDKYKFYLLDEFQDTAPIQSEIFFRLTSKINPKDWKECKPVPGSLFIVGDPKQSIYHFRGADICAYKEIIKLFDNGIGERLSLEKNFRSNTVLCDYFNKTFSNIMPITNEIQTAYPTNGIPLECTRKPINQELNGVYTFASHKDDENVIANLVLTLHNKYKYDYKDIMITPMFTTKINDYKVALNNLGIPCFAEGQISFADSSLVSTIVSLCHYMVNKDEYIKFELLLSPLFNFSLDSTFSTNVKEFDDLIFEYENELPSNLLEKIAENPILYERYGVGDIDLLIGLINIVKSYEILGEIITYSDMCNKLQNLLFEDKTDRISLLNNDLDAVRIANVHKVKGLQSPIVILPYSKDSNKNVKYIIDNKNLKAMLLSLDNEQFFNVSLLKTSQFDKLIDKEQAYLRAEKDRLLYVATTRAEEILFIADEYQNNTWESIIPTDKKTFVINENLVEETDDGVEVKTLFENNDNIVDKNKQFVNEKSYTTFIASKIQSSSSKTFDYCITDYEQSNDRNKSLAFGSAVHKLLEYIVKSKGNIKNLNLLCESISDEYSIHNLAASLVLIGSTILHNGGFIQTQSKFDSDLISYIKKYECYSEVQYCFNENNEIHSGIIDLLINVGDNKYVIIDYKTDKDISTDHTPQLNEYKKAVFVLLNGTAEAYIYNININF